MNRTPSPNTARPARFEAPRTGGNVLLLGPRHRPPLSDDLTLLVQHHTTPDIHPVDGPDTATTPLDDRQRLVTAADLLSSSPEPGTPVPHDERSQP
ncbi:hypothetical protein BJY16_001807 [Actinoplanes octamycinicus]|uniref:Uncharacterized protein n=1 Tax=Actinoplanes octamycinicus TaxID=135948 RepID=A0A7W7M628_9ACTN|nr:hypothetical protein [Actinoplanes octamycinicus]MBB4738348.1 hypothetical protein [Actinoplanes octamycinicus]GIE57465.1 hypothetical protein Aoc01nite_28670 [Actinoplanes octamycinicus]